MTTRDEQFRHQCEVRELLRMYAARGAEAVHRFIADVRRHRGDVMADRLLADTREQWRRGNRGAEGEWRS